VPYSKFMKMGKRMVAFWDLKGKVETAKGIRDMAIICKPGRRGPLLRQGPKVKFKTPGAGTIEITLAFRGQSGDPADNVCQPGDAAVPPGAGRAHRAVSDRVSRSRASASQGGHPTISARRGARSAAVADAGRPARRHPRRRFHNREAAGAEEAVRRSPPPPLHSSHTWWLVNQPIG
jgi:hypothetical protein